MRRTPAAALVLAASLLASACAADDEGEGSRSGSGDVVEFEDALEDAEPELPADDGVDVADAPQPDEVPPTDARLEPGGWPEAAAFIAREADAGRPTLVNIFASWCAPCRSEMPMLVEAWQDNPDVAFLGIDHIDRLEDGEGFVDDLGVDFPTIHDLEGDVAFAVGSRAMPTTVVFDRDGRMAARVFGEVNEDQLAQLLDEVR